jgi:hypothetical protein
MQSKSGRVGLDIHTIPAAIFSNASAQLRIAKNSKLCDFV